MYCNSDIFEDTGSKLWIHSLLLYDSLQDYELNREEGLDKLMTQKRKNLIPDAKTFMTFLEHFVFVSIVNIFNIKVIKH